MYGIEKPPIVDGPYLVPLARGEGCLGHWCVRPNLFQHPGYTPACVLLEEHDGADVRPAGAQKLQALLLGLGVSELVGPNNASGPLL